MRTHAHLHGCTWARLSGCEGRCASPATGLGLGCLDRPCLCVLSAVRPAFPAGCLSGPSELRLHDALLLSSGSGTSAAALGWHYGCMCRMRLPLSECSVCCQGPPARTLPVRAPPGDCIAVVAHSPCITLLSLQYVCCNGLLLGGCLSGLCQSCGCTLRSWVIGAAQIPHNLAAKAMQLLQLTCTTSSMDLFGDSDGGSLQLSLQMHLLMLRAQATEQIHVKSSRKPTQLGLVPAAPGHWVPCWWRSQRNPPLRRAWQAHT